MEGFYVSAIDGTKKALVSGPYATHQAALDDVDRVKLVVRRNYDVPWSTAWGTARVQNPTLPDGKCNAAVGFTPQVTA